MLNYEDFESLYNQHSLRLMNKFASKQKVDREYHKHVSIHEFMGDDKEAEMIFRKGQDGLEIDYEFSKLKDVSSILEAIMKSH